MVVTNQQMAIANAMKDTTYSTNSQPVRANVNMAIKKYQINKGTSNRKLCQSKEELILTKTYGNKWAEVDLDAQYHNLSFQSNNSKNYGHRSVRNY